MQTTVPRIASRELYDIYKEMQPDVEDRVFNIDLKGWLKTMLQDVSLVEFEHTVVGAPLYVRGTLRRNQRNGFYQRSLDTVLGVLEDLSIPRPRKGGFTPSWLPKKRARRQKALDRLATECFWRGISTRDVQKVTKAFCNVSISPAVVSRLTAQWSQQVGRWHQRLLRDDYVYLVFDGIWIKNRSLGVRKRLILAAYGIKADGSRVMIDYTFAESESESNWLRFLTNLHHRGLEGRNLKLITTDGCKGLANALAIVYPTIDHQLCWAHKMRNVLNNVRVDDQPKVKAGLSPLFHGI
jgi:putative transposase